MRLRGAGTSGELTTLPSGLFLLSFRQRDELAGQAIAAGWRTVAARRAEDVERRYLSSGASIAVIDARGALDEGLRAAAALGETVEVNGGALLVLVARGDVGAVADFYDRGATHVLTGPHGEQEFVQALRFAARHVARLGGGWRDSGGEGAPLGWRAAYGTRQVVLTPALAGQLGTAERTSARSLVRRIGTADRALMFAALRRLRTRDATAFAHDLPGGGRVVAHVQRDGQGLTAFLEPSVADAAQPAFAAADTVRQASQARRWLDRRLIDGGAAPPLSALLIALGRFEMVNAAFGRSTGDQLLRAALRRVAEVADELIGRGAMVARIGGSEFLLAAAGDPVRIRLIAERVAEALARPFVAEGVLTALGCRIGVATAVAGDDSAALLRRASEALADARLSDASTIRFADDATELPATIDELAVSLRRAIDAGEIEVLFQPQVAIANGAIVGVEALARWDHPALGSIGAETLFAAAERADLALALSAHLQRLAIAAAAVWPSPLAGLRLAVNVTAADIARPGFADMLLDRVDTAGFARERLTVEITEGGLIDDLGGAAAVFAALRAAGCRVAIDDFGTGYSSLAYLKALPLDYLKIDRKLAQDIAGSPRDRVVVRGVIDMARSLGLAVVAEGVETTEQLDLLAKEGCNFYQGFLCAGALTSAALAELVERQP